MKNYIRLLLILLVLFMSFILLAACDSNTEKSEGDEAFSYSDGIDGKGFWKGIKALNYVENFNYRGIAIPADAHQVSDAYLQLQIDSIMIGYSTRMQIMDRAIAYGDTVNIDYVGKIDGVVFDGGSTMGVGVDVAIVASEDIDNTEEFLDGFLQQLIGRTPGETVDITVSFPADYQVKSRQGKEAVFTTNINYIVEIEGLSDDFVAKNLSSSYGWTTVEEMLSGLRAGAQKNFVQQYLQQFLRTEVPVKSIPELLIKHQERTLLYNITQHAEAFGMGLEEYLLEYEDGSSVEDFMAAGYSELVENATYLLIMQAVAEDLGISVTDEDLTNYSIEHLWSDDYSPQVEEYGLPYVKQVVLCQMVLDYITENAVLQ